MTWFWLSFADGTPPTGQQFLGGLLVEGEGFIDAVKQSHRLGLNPGGEVMGGEVDHVRMQRVADKWMNRLLTRAECEAMDQEMLS